MQTLNVTNFRKNLFSTLEKSIKFNEPVTVSTKEGNVVVLSEADYNGLIETVYLSSTPQLKENIIEGLNTPADECLTAEFIEW